MDFQNLYQRHSYLSAGLLLIAFFVALFGVSAFQVQSLLFSVAVLCFGIFLHLLDRQPQTLLTYEGRWIAGFIVCVSGLAFISIFASDSPYVALLYGGVFALMPLSYALTVRLTAGDDGMRFLAYGFGFFLFLLSLTTIFQYVFFTPYLYKGLINWPLANPNSVAGLLSFGFFGVFALILLVSHQGQRFVAVCLGVLCVSALLATGSRGALFAILLSTPFIFGLLWPFLLRVKWSIAALALSSALVFMLMSWDAEPIKQTPLENFVQTSFTLGLRQSMFQAALDIWSLNPITGTGIGTFFLYYPEYRHGDFETAGLMAHNDIAQYLSEMGLLAPILLYGLVFTILIFFVKRLHVLQSDYPRRVMLVLSFFALGACFLHAHITFHFHIPSLMILMGVCLAFLQSLLAEEPKTEKTLPDSVRMSGVLLLCLGLTLYGGIALGSVYFDRAQKALHNNDLVAFSDAVNRGNQISLGKEARLYLLAADFHLGNLAAQENRLSEVEQDDLIQKIKNSLDQAYALNPRLASLYFSKGQLLSLVPNAYASVTSRQMFAKAVQLNPQHITARLRLADIDLRAGDRESALQILADGLDWPYTQVSPLRYYEVTAQLALDAGNADVRDKALKKIAGFMSVRNRAQKQKEGALNFMKQIKAPLELIKN